MQLEVPPQRALTSAAYRWRCFRELKLTPCACRRSNVHASNVVLLSGCAGSWLAC